MVQRKDDEESYLGGDMENLTTSMTGIELSIEDSQHPAQRIRDRFQDEQDIHRASDPKEREGLFLKSLPSRYKVYERLGDGHSGCVFAAQEQPDDPTQPTRLVAIKLLETTRGGYIGRRVREFAAHRYLPPHPNLVETYTQELSVSGYEYFVMELCDLSLDGWIKENCEAEGRNPSLPALDPIDTIKILHDLLRVSALLRELDVKHRDIRPANILLKLNPDSKQDSRFPYTVKLADFGLADIQVVRPSVPYDNYFGVKDEDFLSGRYEFDHDFRAIVASVFAAWVGDRVDMGDSGLAFKSDDSFDSLIGRFEMNEHDEAIYEFFCSALPMPQAVDNEDSYSFEKTIEELEKLGEFITGTKSWTTPIKLSKQERKAPNDDDKLEAYLRSALAVISGRRHAHDYGTAKRYLMWAKDLKQEFQNKFEWNPPDDIEHHFHTQWALVLHLPKLQELVTKYIKASAGDGSETSIELELIGGALLDEKNQLEERTMSANKYAVSITEKATIKNIEALRTFELVKFSKASKGVDEAMFVAKRMTKDLLNFLTDLEKTARDDYSSKARQTRIRCFQICRNGYLIIREIVDLLERGTAERIEHSKTALLLCKKGHKFINVDSGRGGDRLEMGRCLAEAHYMCDNFAESREICKQLYEEFVDSSTQLSDKLARLLRVVAIWVAALKQMPSINQDTELAFEMGYASGILIASHREAARSLLKNKHALTNAQQFLSSNPARHDNIMKTPLLPSFEFVRKDGDLSLKAMAEA